jgi:hypothetical protein
MFHIITILTFKVRRNKPLDHKQRHCNTVILLISDIYKLLKPNGYYMCHLIIRTKTLHYVHVIYLCVSYDS